MFCINLKPYSLQMAILVSNVEYSSHLMSLYYTRSSIPLVKLETSGMKLIVNLAGFPPPSDIIGTLEGSAAHCVVCIFAHQ